MREPELALYRSCTAVGETTVERDDGRTLTEAFTAAIAAAEGVAPTELPPLNEPRCTTFIFRSSTYWTSWTTTTRIPSSSHGARPSMGSLTDYRVDIHEDRILETADGD